MSADCHRVMTAVDTETLRTRDLAQPEFMLLATGHRRKDWMPSGFDFRRTEGFILLSLAYLQFDVRVTLRRLNVGSCQVSPACDDVE